MGPRSDNPYESDFEPHSLESHVNNNLAPASSRPGPLGDPAAAERAVNGQLSYLKPTAERPYSYACEPPEGVPWENCEYELRPMPIADARGIRQCLSIDAEGFE